MSERESFSRWYDEYKSMIKSTARKIHPILCDDLAADATLQIFQQWIKNEGLGYYESKGKPEAYYYVIIWRSCVKALRRFRDKLYQAKDFQYGSYTTNNDRMELDDMLTKLSPRERDVINHCLQGLPVSSFDTSKSTRTTYRTLESAIENLKRLLGNDTH